MQFFRGGEGGGLVEGIAEGFVVCDVEVEVGGMG